MFKRIHWVLVLLCVTGTAVAQNCRDDILAGVVPPHFQDNGDGTITDLATGLIWKQCTEGSNGSDCGEGHPALFTYPVALRIAADAEFAGSDHWRLPTKEELDTLADRNCQDPVIDIRYFPNTPADWFWSASTGGGATYYAWGVNFADGKVGGDAKSGIGYVRLVRYGP
ncbi:Protein of unknown function (DUF1566) [Thioflavicoccus mobilis 8321]|uniref:Lcl C-terminal domain-containing protein n=1 Tax=Thioflavicoccus mobilis 8321 TaxID=765912 RepID=L0GVB5_9GAMM|nr:DUF1566 domain-containing protein [Thioflavicoccus mobilis]AGA89310.1 Protein of unknown function (DUF1566) [Thioflavicoccus mobilis 8321]